jgi:Oxidoreductase molybdopterin binding domain
MLLPLLAISLWTGDSPAAAVNDALIDGLPQVDASFTAHGKTQICKGPTLQSILKTTGIPEQWDKDVAPLSATIIATAADGYRVAFSLGELNAELGNTPVIVTKQCDGKALSPEDGPFRLVVPGEKRAARSVRQLVELRLNRPQ